MARVAELGTYLLNGLRALQSGHAEIWEVRGKGLLIGVELDRTLAPKGEAIERRLLEAGFLIDYQPHTATFRLFPPYVISREEIDRFLKAFETALDTI